jgi:hypothetical protein
MFGRTNRFCAEVDLYTSGGMEGERNLGFGCWNNVVEYGFVFLFQSVIKEQWIGFY